MPADLSTRYAVDGSTPGSELADAGQQLTSAERARLARTADGVHERVVALDRAAVDDVLDRLESTR